MLENGVQGQCPHRLLEAPGPRLTPASLFLIHVTCIRLFIRSRTLNTFSLRAYYVLETQR